MQYHTRSEEETIALGRKLAQELGGVVLLSGNLGAGKTTLAKGIVSGSGAAPQQEVSSPTFTLVHEYGEPPRVYHIDLYRLDSEAEAATLGLDEIFDSGALILIEWGERFPRLIPRAHTRIAIDHVSACPDDREITVTYISE